MTAPRSEIALALRSRTRIIPVGDIKQSAICGNSAVSADVWNVNHSVHQQTLRHLRQSNRVRGRWLALPSLA